MARSWSDMEPTKSVPELAATRMHDARVQERGNRRMLSQSETRLHRGLYNSSNILGGGEEDGTGQGRGRDNRDVGSGSEA